MTKTVKIVFTVEGSLMVWFSFFKEILQKISALLYTGSIRIAEESRMRELPKDEKKQNIWSSSTTSERGENMYKFYGWETADITDARGLTPRDCYDIFSRVWCAETCAPRMRASWTPENKTLGQCSVTAFLVQDIYGGEVRGVPQKNGTFHCFNVVGDCVFDLTSEQFGSEALDYDDCPEQLREVHFAKEEKRQRYEYLREQLLARLQK